MKSRALKSCLYPLLLILFSCSFVYSQKSKSANVQQKNNPVFYLDTLGKERDTIYTVAEEMPTFMGGEKQLKKFIRTMTQGQYIEKDCIGSGDVMISFIVKKDGQITDITVQKEIEGCLKFSKEAIRVVKTIPAGKPAKQSGKAVSFRMTIPVHFYKGM